jgi:hypothetical protein
VTLCSNNDSPGKRDWPECGWSVDEDEVVVDGAVENVGVMMWQRGHERTSWGHERSNYWLDRAYDLRSAVGILTLDRGGW